jgi:hypothetical protein
MIGLILIDRPSGERAGGFLLETGDDSADMEEIVISGRLRNTGTAQGQDGLQLSE